MGQHLCSNVSCLPEGVVQWIDIDGLTHVEAEVVSGLIEVVASERRQRVSP